MKKVSFVITNYNGWSMVHQLLFDIFKTCHLPSIHEVIVVNNGCTEPESFSGLEWWVSTGILPVREVRLEKNIGFLRAANAGMREAKGDVVCLVSNDVRIHDDVVSFITKSGRTLFGGRLLDYDTGWNSFDGRVFPYLEGWLLATDKSVWEELGYFDERFAPNDMEDVDLSTSALASGCILFPIPDGYATHIGAQTLKYTPEREEITKKNREKFREKWVTARTH